MRLTLEQMKAKRNLELAGIRNAIWNALPEGTTNRDVFEIMFPDMQFYYDTDDNDQVVLRPFDGMPREWFNAPYKKEVAADE